MEMVEDAKKELKLKVNASKCKRLKKIRIELTGSYTKEFGYLATCISTVKKINPGIITDINFYIRKN